MRRTNSFADWFAYWASISTMYQCTHMSNYQLKPMKKRYKKPGIMLAVEINSSADYSLK